MARFCGNVGFEVQKEVRPGIWKGELYEKVYYGDLIKNVQNFHNPGNVIDDINVQNQISIVADEFALRNYHFIKYVELNNVRWKVTSIIYQLPRLVLTVGGVYNG